ncbi:MAG: DUF1598 domain-containing protein [Pirellulaceae bacterium]|nr:DUF1598 domain-containing protein [Pirellulaceae bacterium]
MSNRQFTRMRVVAGATLLFAVLIGSVQAGHRIFRQNAVGGISIDPEGVVREPSVESRKMLLSELRKGMEKVAPDLTAPVPLRKISLKRLHAAIEESLRTGIGRLPDEIRYLAGLQRIQYIFVYPEENDIVLCGPGEGWRIDDNANVVGVTTGRPVLLLDDLLIALRNADNARNGGISCSIDPTEQGYKRLNALLAKQKQVRSQRNLPALEKAMKEAFGPQQVSIQGVPANSHFARVLVAADYRMKRLAMNLDKSPISSLPSYVQMLKSSRDTSSNPRWWLACNYEPMVRSEDGLAWELKGPGVKAMTEDDLVTVDGKVKGTGKTSPTAQKWADLMTDQYDRLSGEDVVFAELRNIMDMSIVAAAIAHHDLLGVSGLSAPMLFATKSDLTVETWNSPKTIAPQCSFVKSRKGWIVTASGGVSIESWQVASKSIVDNRMSNHREAAQGGKHWWWN